MKKILYSVILTGLLMLPFVATASSDNVEVRHSLLELKLQAMQITDQFTGTADTFTGVCKPAYDSFALWLFQFRAYASDIGTSDYNAGDTKEYLVDAKNAAADLAHYNCIDSEQFNVVNSQLAKLDVALDAVSKKYHETV